MDLFKYSHCILYNFYLFFCRTANIKDGVIKMNGKERNLSQFRKLSAYIMQDNQLHGNITVEEAMIVATSLKLSTKVDKSEKIVVVSYVFKIYYFQVIKYN